MRIALVFAVFVVACSAGGTYVTSERQGGVSDRGDTNGRRFDFVSNKPTDDDWQIRITGSSMWVSYGRDAATDKLGSIVLTDKEVNKVWRLIDMVDIPSRKKGRRDEDEGDITLRLKEEGGDAFVVYVSRTTEDEDVLALAEYLQDLVEKYKKERPNF